MVRRVLKAHGEEAVGRVRCGAHDSSTVTLSASRAGSIEPCVRGTARGSMWRMCENSLCMMQMATSTANPNLRTSCSRTSIARSSCSAMRNEARYTRENSPFFSVFACGYSAWRYFPLSSGQ